MRYRAIFVCLPAYLGQYVVQVIEILVTSLLQVGPIFVPLNRHIQYFRIYSKIKHPVLHTGRT